MSRDSLILQAVNSYRFYPHSPHCLDPSHQECRRAMALAGLMRSIEVMGGRAKLPPDAASVVAEATDYARLVLGRSVDGVAE